MADRKILLSGVKPTGRPHIGNYFGAMRQFVGLQDEYEAHIFIADLHALTTVQSGAEMSESILGVLLDYLAIGLDPEKCVIYKQSDAPQVTELTWILNCLTTMPYLERAHAFKDAVANGKEASVGLFDYPILMAADILLPGADVVPVGQDQKQHVEIARDTAEKFNRVFGQEVFKLPEPMILGEVAVVPGTDGRKMSKSYGNTIPLFATEEEIEKAVMSIVTDSSGEKPEHVYAIHALLREPAEIDALYEEFKGQYKKLKELLIEDLKKFIGPLRERRETLAENPGVALSLLQMGGEKARARAEAKMEEVRQVVGLKLY